MKFEDYYSHLHIDYTEDLDAIKKQGEKLLKTYEAHTSSDQDKSIKDIYIFLAERVKEALAVLTNPKAKAKYDILWHKKMQLNYRMTRIKSAIATVVFLASLGFIGKIVTTSVSAGIEEQQYNATLQIDQDAIAKMIIEEDLSILANSSDSQSKLESLKTELFDSIRLTDAGKDYLWNGELLRKVLPYYDPETFITIYGRHYNLGVVPFTQMDEHRLSDGVLAYYDDKDRIHARGYKDDFNFPQGDKLSLAIAHEYVHLLQLCPSGTIKEASAQIITREFFGVSHEYQSFEDYIDSLKSGKYSDFMVYTKDVQYLKILIEIIGPEPVWKFNFEQNSTALYDAVRDYLTPEQLDLFKSIATSHPNYDKSITPNKFYEDYFDLLKIIYRNKYGTEMDQNEMIKSILNYDRHTRIYFNRSIEDKHMSCYYRKEADRSLTKHEVESVFSIFPDQNIGSTDKQKAFRIAKKQ